jgi:hypothetical protein
VYSTIFSETGATISEAAWLSSEADWRRLGPYLASTLAMKQSARAPSVYPAAAMLCSAARAYVSSDSLAACGSWPGREGEKSSSSSSSSSCSLSRAKRGTGEQTSTSALSAISAETQTGEPARKESLSSIAVLAACSLLNVTTALWPFSCTSKLSIAPANENMPCTSSAVTLPPSSPARLMLTAFLFTGEKSAGSS